VDEQTCQADRSQYDTKIKVNPDQIHQTGAYTFYLTYTAVGGAKKTTPEITLNTVCGPASTTVAVPTTSSPYSYSLVYNDPDLPRVELDPATSSIAACPVDQWVLTSDGISNTILDGIQTTVYKASSKEIVKVLQNLVDVPGSYSFYLTYIAKGGVQATTPKLELKTKCDIGSTQITASDVPAVTNVELGDHDGGFVFDQFVNTHAYCTNIKYSITIKDQSVQHPGFDSVLQLDP